MRSEQEIRNRLAACKMASRRFMFENITKDCPIRHGVCPECSTEENLEWVLNRNTQAKKARGR